MDEKPQWHSHTFTHQPSVHIAVTTQMHTDDFFSAVKQWAANTLNIYIYTDITYT